MCLSLLKSSIGKKQIVATTGLLLIFFLIGHLIGNFLIYGGPDLFNGYAAMLKKAKPVVLFIELALLPFSSPTFLSQLLWFMKIKRQLEQIATPSLIAEGKDLWRHNYGFIPVYFFWALWFGICLILRLPIMKAFEVSSKIRRWDFTVSCTTRS